MFKTPQEIQHMRDSANILSKVHGAIAANIHPGISERALNDLAEKAIAAHGAQPSFKGFNNFPAAICTSVNDKVVHGVPSSYILQQGDIISIDCGVYYRGFHADCAFTHIVGTITKESLHLLAVTKKALYVGIEAFKNGNTLGDVGHAIQSHVKNNGLYVIENYSGHGIGRRLHEPPLVHNVGTPGKGTIIREGMVVAIEPIVAIGTPVAYEAKKWHVHTKGKQLACHFEHTVAIVNGKTEVLTTFDYINNAKKLYE